jgi:hypothetical protein
MKLQISGNDDVRMNTHVMSKPCRTRFAHLNVSQESKVVRAPYPK